MAVSTSRKGRQQRTEAFICRKKKSPDFQVVLTKEARNDSESVLLTSDYLFPGLGFTMNVEPKHETWNFLVFTTYNYRTL